MPHRYDLEDTLYTRTVFERLVYVYHGVPEIGRLGTFNSFNLLCER